MSEETAVETVTPKSFSFKLPRKAKLAILAGTVAVLAVAVAIKTNGMQDETLTSDEEAALSA